MAVEEMAVEEMAVEEMAVALNKYRFVFKYGFFLKPRNGGTVALNKLVGCRKRYGFRV